MEIYINNNQNKIEIDEKYWTDFSNKIFDLLKLEEDTEVSITFTDNTEIQQLNKEYRNKDYPTDVLSFPFDNEFNLPVNNILGDIIISLEKSTEQAIEYGHSFNRETSFLIVHGILHLLGYDHENEEDEKEMFDLQKELLKDFIF
ncbi:MAG: rRNA maturation RNase YbeY [Cyanobacteriota bacterium]